MPKPPTQTFRATLEKLQGNLGWTIVRVPFDPAAAFPAMLRHRVSGAVNGFAFRTSLFPFSAPDSGYFLLVNRAMQQGSGASLGDAAEFTLQADLDPRPADLPAELDALLDEADGLRSFYDSLSESTRREIGKWIAVAKSDPARLKRCEQIAERLLSTMEAERDLPPQIAQALRATPGAMPGWRRLTPTQQRSELMAFFYYQSPEARAKRLAKTVALAASKSTR